MPTESTPAHEARLSLAVALTAAVTAIAFHFLFFRHPYGVALVIFLLILFAGIHLLAVLTEKRGNPWAYIFAVPFVLALAAELLYASDVVRAFGFIIAVGSLTFFAYWFTAPPARFWETASLWPVTLFTESFFPFPRFLEYIDRFTKGKRQLSRIFVGVAIAVPFLLVLGYLFVSADALVRKTLEDAFSAEHIVQQFVRALWDAFALIFFASSGWMIVTRLTNLRRPVHRAAYEWRIDRVVASTFLILLNVLFAAFIGFQAVYFFGGEAIIQSRGLAYAQYAREGFFQLLAVAVIVTGIVGVMIRYADVRSWLIRGASIALVAQTGVVIASALRRMALYIDAYGLSVLRVWATLGMLVLAGVLLFGVIAIVTNVAYGTIVKGVSVTVLAAAAAGLLINVEGIVANYNVDAYLSGKTERMDVAYLATLSSDAVPALVRLAAARPELPVGTERDFQEVQSLERLLADPSLTEASRRNLEPALAEARERIRPLRTVLEQKKAKLESERSDWRNLVFADYNALAALGTLK